MICGESTKGKRMFCWTRLLQAILIELAKVMVCFAATRGMKFVFLASWLDNFSFYYCASAAQLLFGDLDFISSYSEMEYKGRMLCEPVACRYTMINFFLCIEFHYSFCFSSHTLVRNVSCGYIWHGLPHKFSIAWFGALAVKHWLDGSRICITTLINQDTTCLLPF